MNRTPLVIDEELDALKSELQGYIALANRTGRDLSAAQAARVEAISIEKHRLLAEKRQVETKLREQVMARHPSATVFNQSSYSGDQRPEQVLETHHARRDEGFFPQVRSHRLKAFSDERQAIAAGNFLRAIEARLSGRGQDAKSEEACRRFGMEITNASYEGSGTSGGYLVPPQISSGIIEVRERVGIARRVCQIYQTTSDSISIPKRSGGLTVYYPNELQTITDSDKSWAQVSLAAEKRAVASKISQELMDDALISIVDNVFTEMAYALALREDAELCNGDGTSAYGGVTGLRSAIGSAGVYTCPANKNLWSEIVLEDVMNTMSKLPDRFNRNPVWICSSNFYWGVFGRLLAAGAGNTASDLAMGPGGTRSFFGVPVLTSSQMPVADADSTIHALFGQFDMAVILADRTGIRIGRDDSTGFLADYTTLKATSRYDIKVHEGGDSSNAGAYVALKTNAA